MKNLKTVLVITMLCFLNAVSVFGKEYTGNNKSAPAPDPGVTAGCAPATAATELDINNTRALILAGGDMWWDLTSAKYEIPKGSGIHALFVGDLWIGGQDVSGQLKVAGQRYRRWGNDYWPGPLSTESSEIESATCTQYDKHFVTYRDQIARFNAWYEAGLLDQENGTSTQQEDFPNYSIPDTILNWPAHGRNYAPYDEDFNLAPFYDRNGDGVYNPLDGDYPGYDLKGEIDCSERLSSIYGDMNLWWVFNDKGNVHTETGSNAIGMEIRGQAFGFATNDEVNNMTFYNYELINRSTFTLTETYFGFNVDADLGCYLDDYVGCDVERGLGYTYNGKAIDSDCSGAKGYGEQPPAIGVDYFQGPFQDNDGIDNPLTLNYNDAILQKGIPYPGIGVGYGDGIPDNERLGMRAFMWYNNGGCITCDPETGVQYYDYLRGFWKDGSRMYYGGNGHKSNGGDPNVPANYMFPGDTDPVGWGTGGIPQQEWTEEIAGNSPADRRFIHSSGPFTLAPGAVNFITVGVVWARAVSGGPFSSVEELKRADDKTQAMFDNCFRVLNGPDAPDVAIQELDKELILYLTNKKISLNFNEEYEEVSPFIFPPDTVKCVTPNIILDEATKEEMRKYTFQGYMVYQLKDATVSPADLDNLNLARLVAQCDIKDGIGQIVNLYYDTDLQQNVPVEEVNGADEGIRHSFKITEDKFASGDNKLVNHKQYYFMVLAYGHNNAGSLTQQEPYCIVMEPFLASRKSAVGGIKVYTGIPHKPAPEAGGTQINSEYGDGVELTRIEGQGNNGTFLQMKQEDINAIMSGSPWRVDNPTYERGQGPVTIKVVDPLNVPAADFTIAFMDTTDRATTGWSDLTDAYWAVWRNDTTDTVFAIKSITVQNEQLLLNWGLSVTIEQVENPSTSTTNPTTYGNAYINAKLSFEDDSKRWLTGVPDQDGGCNPQNWIRAGTLDDPNDATCNDYPGKDDDEVYEKLLGGTWAPYKITSNRYDGPVNNTTTLVLNLNNWDFLQSVDIVFTADQSKWTRCPVIEMQTENTLASGNPGGGPSTGPVGFLRDAPSVGKDGLPDGTGTSMGWFPGYAINVETGERLNMAFGEDSWLEEENGNDMIWNPTTNIDEGPWNDIRFGGKHYVFVFRNNVVEDASMGGIPKPADRMPAYDDGTFTHDQLITAINNTSQGFRNVWRTCMWVGLPLVAENQTLLSTDATVSIRVTNSFKPYGIGTLLSEGDPLTIGETYLVHQGPVQHDAVIYKRDEWFTAWTTSFIGSGGATDDHADNLYTTVNSGLPMYTFSTHDLAATTNSLNLAIDALDLIYVVPNPYYAYAEYEADKLDYRVKVINLPQTCTVTIYTVNGTLVRRYEKDDPTITSLDWDLKNHAGIPIASGLYIIHINVPGVGEKVLKWFGSLRPFDLDAF